MATSLGTGYLCLQLLADGIKAVRVCFSQVILDLDRAAHVDEFLHALLVLIRESAILPTLDQLVHLFVDGIQLGNVCSQAIRNRGVPIFICRSFQFLQFGTGGGRDGFEGILPLLHNGIGFLFAIRPHGENAIHPTLHIAGFPFEVCVRHTEERKPIAPAIESVSSSVTPVLSGLCHTFQGFSSLPGTTCIVHNGGSRRNRCNGNSHPYGRRFA